MLASMTPDSDDLEKELRRNLKLRRELGAQAAKGEGGTQRQTGRWDRLPLGAGSLLGMPDRRGGLGRGLIGCDY
jgi:hypothetical protein